MQRLCEYLHLSRGAYYRWLKNPASYSEKYNKEISEKIKDIHEAHPDMGYRRIRDELDKKHGIAVNDKRDRFKLDLLTNERKMAFCMVYLLYQLQEVISYDGKTKRTNPDGHP